jgi:hypothetical protein
LRFLTGFIQFVDAMVDRIGKIASFLVYPTMLVLVYEVVMRYYFTRPTIWAHETSCMLYGAHFIIGGETKLTAKTVAANTARMNKIPRFLCFIEAPPLRLTPRFSFLENSNFLKHSFIILTSGILSRGTATGKRHRS